MFLVIIIIIILLICYMLTYFKNKRKSNCLTEEVINKYESQLEELDEKTLDSIREKLEQLYYPDPVIMPSEILTKKDFGKSFTGVSFLAHLMDKRRNVSKVELLAHFIVKYYAPYILKYGNVYEKTIYCNNIEILKRYKQISG